jgi:dihydrolipoamide dehydrogenase
MYKAVIIGAGPAGYTCAIRIAQLGGKAALIERDLIGGICVNWGCTPSKAMISSAKAAKAVAEAGAYGVEVNGSVINFGKVAERRDEVMRLAREEIKHLLDHWGVDVIQGTGEVIDLNHVKVGDQVLETENIVYATGSQPLVPPFLQKEDASIVNSNKLITINELPAELTIVGGGIIGLEFATIFSNLGTKVRIIEFLDRCLATMDPEISAAITKELEAKGVEILTGHKVLDITEGKLKVEVAATGEQKELDSPLNLIAIGRKAVINNPEFDKLGIQYTPKGIIVNELLQTNFPNIYAVGDATGLSILAHVAIQQGIFSAENMYAKNRVMDYSVIPAVVYTLPEVSTVGTVPADLTGIKVVKFPFSANLRANIEGHNTGFVKLWVNEADKTLIAAQMVGDMAGEIIQAYGNAVALKTPIDQIANIIHAHPTFNEIVRNSFEHALGRAIEYFD